MRPSEFRAIMKSLSRQCPLHYALLSFWHRFPLCPLDKNHSNSLLLSRWELSKLTTNSLSMRPGTILHEFVHTKPNSFEKILIKPFYSQLEPWSFVTWSTISFYLSEVSVLWEPEEALEEVCTGVSVHSPISLPIQAKTCILSPAKD